MLLFCLNNIYSREKISKMHHMEEQILSIDILMENWKLRLVNLAHFYSVLVKKYTLFEETIF